MKEIFTEEEYQEVLKNFYKETQKEFCNDRTKYLPYEGLSDLRNYSLNSEEFKLLWICQEMLSCYEKSKSMVNIDSRNLCESIKLLYSDLIKTLG